MKTLGLGLLVTLISGAAGTGSSAPVWASGPSVVDAGVPCAAPGGCAAKSDLIERIVLLTEGARPRWSPDGKALVFDRANADGYFDLYSYDLATRQVTALTAGNRAIGQRNNGNAVLSPLGRFVVFISEEDGHLGDNAQWMANPGLGLFSNLWATDLAASRFWKLTEIPIKKRLFDQVPAMATVNPVFSSDGHRLIWTERYEGPQSVRRRHNWGRWRIKMAELSVREGVPRLESARVIFTPAKGNYVTALGFFDPTTLLLAGNLDGQHEYGMDHYSLDLQTGTPINLSSTPEIWEEGACIAADGHTFFHMSNAASRRKLDFEDPDWSRQPLERDYWISDRDRRTPQRLTFFNDRTAPEFMGRRVQVAACSVSPDGRRIAATVGLDHGGDRTVELRLYVAVIDLERRPAPAVDNRK